MAAIGRILLIPKGDYNGITTYNSLDWVRHNGASWMCKENGTIGIEPSALADEWQLMAQDGSVSGSVDWENVNYKPFVGVGDGLNVNSGTLNIELDTEYLTGSNISYDNSGSGLTADTVQDAIDELVSSGGGGNLEDLGDVSISSVSNGQILEYDAITDPLNPVWVNADKPDAPNDSTITIQKNGTDIDSFTTNASSDTDIDIPMDDWTAEVTASTSGGNVQAVFNNLNNNYGYDLYCENTLVGIKSMTKGTGTETGTIKLTYVLDGATSGVTKCKLRILK